MKKPVVKNAFAFLFSGVIAILLCLYAAGAIFTGVVWGFGHVEMISFSPFPGGLKPTVFTYWEYLSRYSAEELAKEDAFFTIKLYVCTALPFAFILWMLFSFFKDIKSFQFFKTPESLHGDAQWATEKDIREKAKLREPKGMLLGNDSKGYLVADGFQHALLFAPTGSGKGVGFVIPNLLFWQDSCFVHDIKLENYELTSGWRKNQLGQKVYLWNPASPRGITHCYNPLDWISDSPGQKVDDVQKIASLLLPEQEFWKNEARSLFVGVALYLMANPYKVRTFGEVVRTLRSDDVFFEMAKALDAFGGLMSPVGYMNIAAFMQKSPKERSGVISTLNSALELWANPLIDSATAKSDFNIMEFKKDPTTVYVGLTPDNIKRLQPLMQIFYQQASEFLCRHMPLPDEKHGVLFIMDEFPTLGKMEQFQSGIAYFRGYKVRLFLIVQDTEQLKGIYEESGMNSFLTNATYRITFAANNVQTATLISELIGNKTVEQKSVSAQQFTISPFEKNIQRSEAERALLLPQEVIGLPRDEQILLIEACPPIKSKKIKYFEDPMFTSRLLEKIEIPTQEPFDVSKHGPKLEIQEIFYPTINKNNKDAA